ncbi:MAG: glycosyltransferase [Candidatus Brockarchaeota archaeon]|nr:glycosyltransferase [Candidatus Brockarchaeota archaeon]
MAHFLGSYCKELARLGHEPHVFTTGGLLGGGNREESWVHRFRSVKFPLYVQYRIAPAPFLGALRAARKLDVDVVHIQTPFFMGTAGFISGKVMEVPIVGTYHTNFLEMSESVSDSKVFKGFVRFAWKYSTGLYRRCHVLTTSSRTIAEHLRRLMRREVLTVPHGVDVERFGRPVEGVDVREIYGIPSDKAIVTYLGRLTRDKGVHTLLDAFSEVRKKARACLVVAGLGPEKEALEKRSVELGMAEDTRFLGYVEEAEKVPLLQQSNVVVLVSKADLVPLVLIEAMACGTPVIGSRAGGIPNLIEDGETGFLVREGDPKELSEKILEVISGADLEGVKRKAKELVKREFSMEVSARAFLDIYRKASKS